MRYSYYVNGFRFNSYLSDFTFFQAYVLLLQVSVGVLLG